MGAHATSPVAQLDAIPQPEHVVRPLLHALEHELARRSIIGSRRPRCRCSTEKRTRRAHATARKRVGRYLTSGRASAPTRLITVVGHAFGPALELTLPERVARQNVRPQRLQILARLRDERITIRLGHA